MKLFTLKNLSSHEVQTTADKEIIGKKFEIPGKISSKEEYIKWGQNPQTEYCYYSTLSGANPDIRISKDNPPKTVQGFVMDYDALLGKPSMDEILARCNPDIKPCWFSNTYSGGGRLLFAFGAELPWFGKDFWKKFVKKFVKEARIKQLLPGYDEKSTEETRYFALGTGWKELGGKPISKSLLYYWVEQVSNTVDWKTGQVFIPMEKIREELESRFPGKWAGEFDLGRRGCRFWDESASNPTAAIVREGGMQCFTGDQAFVPWTQIFGRQFVEQYQADRIGSAVGEIWFDGREYWRQFEIDQVWRPVNRVDIMLHLKEKFGLASVKDKEAQEDNSEVNRALHVLQDKKRVDGAIPIVGWPSGIVHYHKQRYLNTNRIRPLEPRTGNLEELAAGCPFILGFLKDFFDPVNCLDYYLAWLQRGYLSFLNNKPASGQICIIAGEPGTGKTLLGTGIAGPLLGGHCEATEFMQGNTSWNKDLLGYFFWVIDDSTPSADLNKHRKFSANLKKFAANLDFQYNAKFKDNHMIPWRGRVTILCNADAESMRVLPDTDQSLLDKVMMFKVRSTDRKFPGDLNGVLGRELPYFAGYLAAWEAPGRVLGGQRYGIECFHHPELLETARDGTQSSSFLGLLRIFLREWDRNKDWTGSSTQLLHQMSMLESFGKLLGEYNSVKVGRCLNQLQGQGYPITNFRDPISHERGWKIGSELAGIGKKGT